MNWKQHGFDCQIIRHRSGHWCGYVGVPESHPLYGKGYGEYIDTQDWMVEQRSNAFAPIPLLCHAGRGVTNQLPIDLALDVHGGITFSGVAYWPEAEGALWYFGFDCAHCDSPAPDDGEFATDQCNQLAGQLWTGFSLGEKP
jgi:hypothetical protein